MNTRENAHEYLLAFVHIPKTAGTTFSSILRRFYRRGVYTISSQADLEKFKQMAGEDRAQYSLIHGHFFYGIHELVSLPTCYITFLRHPIERILSYYAHVTRDPKHYLHSTVVTNQITLKEFVQSDLTHELYNLQTMIIAGIDSSSVDREVTQDEAHLHLAKQRLANDFWAFGITEFFDESLILMSELLELSPLKGKLYYTRRNFATERPTRAAIDADVMETICQKNHLDLQLYSHTLQLFHMRRENHDKFEEQLGRFQLLNVQEKFQRLWLQTQRRLGFFR